MIVKPLLVERVVAILALNPCNYGMTLALMVGQGQEGAARVVAVQSSLRVNESLGRNDASSYIYDSLFSASILRLSTLRWMVVRQEPRLGMLFPGSRQVALFKVTGHNVMPPSLLPSSRTLATNRDTYEKLPR